MAINQTVQYSLDPHMGEWYDRIETGTQDVEQIRRLIGDRGPLRILELFCGTGRILIPLALDGHELVGIDMSRVHLDRAREKLASLSEDTRRRITLIEADVIAGDWPRGFDVVILGGNCFYELASAEEQESCIAFAAESLVPGGCVYVDNDHMEGDLLGNWCRIGEGTLSKPFICSDGTQLRFRSDTVWVDVPARLWRARLYLFVTHPDGAVTESSYLQQKHPVSEVEVGAWLAGHGFTIEEHYGNHDDEPYRPDVDRATFWARRGD